MPVPQSWRERASGWDRPTEPEKDPALIPDPATTDVPAELREKIERAMARYPERHSAAIPALHAAQELHGWCSPEAIEQVACVMSVTPAYLDSVASFYDMLETARSVATACTCARTSPARCAAPTLCWRRSARRRPASSADFNVRSFECLGACDIAPMASVDGVYVGPLSLEDVPQLLDDARSGRPVLPDKQLATRLVADPHANSQEFPAHAVEKGSSR